MPSNIFLCGNNDANGHYLEQCKAEGIKPYPARFLYQLPSFFVRSLTDPGDLVLDPFAGSNTTGQVCEQEGRAWIAIERDEGYLKASQFRFEPDAPAMVAGGPIERSVNGKRGRPAKKNPDQPRLFD